MEKLINKWLKERKAQEQKSKILVVMPKKAQEEMLGFALIMIVVAVALLVFLSFSIGKSQKENVENYEVENFIQSFLQYTTDCAKAYEPNYLSIQKLIIECTNQGTCLDSRNSCDVLEADLKEIAEKGWEARPIQGYEIGIWAEEEKIMFLEQGNKTKDYKGAMQEFSKAGEPINISFTAYY